MITDTLNEVFLTQSRYFRDKIKLQSMFTEEVKRYCRHFIKSNNTSLSISSHKQVTTGTGRKHQEKK